MKRLVCLVLVLVLAGCGAASEETVSTASALTVECLTEERDFGGFTASPIADGESAELLVRAVLAQYPAGFADQWGQVQILLVSGLHLRRKTRHRPVGQPLRRLCHFRTAGAACAGEVERRQDAGDGEGQRHGGRRFPQGDKGPPLCAGQVPPRHRGDPETGTRIGYVVGAEALQLPCGYSGPQRGAAYGRHRGGVAAVMRDKYQLRENGLTAVRQEVSYG